MTSRSTAQRTYRRRMIAVSIVYLASVFAASAIIKQGDPVTATSVALALLPALGVIGYIWAIMRLMIEEQDEFIRMLIVRQSLIATGIALSAASVWGFLENFGMVEHVAAYWWAIVYFLGFGVGAIVNRVKYGAAGQCL